MTTTDHEALMDHHERPGSGGPRVEGYVVDIACLRRYPPEEYWHRVRVHTSDCALMGHCVESGYALVGEDGRVALLDTHATTHVVDRLQNSAPGRGIYLRADRTEENGEMVTTGVTELHRLQG